MTTPTGERDGKVLTGGDGMVLDIHMSTNATTCPVRCTCHTGGACNVNGGCRCIDTVAALARNIAAAPGHTAITTSIAPCGIALHAAGRNLGIVTAPGHSVALHYTTATGPGRTIREFTDPTAALAAITAWCAA